MMPNMKLKKQGEEKSSEQVEQKTLEMRGNQVISEIIKNQKDMPGEFTKLVHENFWDLINTEHKKLDADEVIEWMEKHYLMTPNGGYYYLPKVCIKQFKKDFGL